MLTAPDAIETAADVLIEIADVQAALRFAADPVQREGLLLRLEDLRLRYWELRGQWLPRADLADKME